MIEVVDRLNFNLWKSIKFSMHNDIRIAVVVRITNKILHRARIAHLLDFAIKQYEQS
jgi:hypothetical protein